MIKDASPRKGAKVAAYKEKDFDNYDEAREYLETWVEMGHPVRTRMQDGVYRVTVYQWRAP